MGFSTLLDILGSTLVGGMLLLILFRMNDAAVENNYMYGGELVVQQNLVAVVELLEFDFRKIGYCEDWEKLADPLLYIIEADSNSIKFRTDLDSDGIVDSLTYFTGSTSELSSTPNPRDKFLYRVENAEKPIGTNLGITQFNLVYYDALGNIIPTPVVSPDLIQMIEINIRVEDVYGYDTENVNKKDSDMYASAFWRQIRLAARNLKNR
jgi:hypothetical protein